MHAKFHPRKGVLQRRIALGGTYTWVGSNWQFDRPGHSGSSGDSGGAFGAFDLLIVADPISTNAVEIPNLSSIEVANALKLYYFTGLCHDILVFSWLISCTNFNPPQNTKYSIRIRLLVKKLTTCNLNNTAKISWNSKTNKDYQVNEFCVIVKGFWVQMIDLDIFLIVPLACCEARLNQSGCHAVSYTHLTLPTIYSV